MEVIDYSNAFYYFLKESEEDYYLDVNCSSGFASFSVLVKLNGSDMSNFKKQGMPYVTSLAEVIAEKSQYNHPRNIKDQQKLDEAHSAIMEWKEKEGSK